MQTAMRCRAVSPTARPRQNTQRMRGGAPDPSEPAASGSKRNRTPRLHSHLRLRAGESSSDLHWPAQARTCLRALPYTVWVQPQFDAQCVVHAINTGLQSPHLTLAQVQRALVAAHPAAQTFASGYLHAGDLALALAHIAPRVQLIEGVPHLGASTGTLWQTTMLAQPQNMNTADFVILFLRPRGAAAENPHTRTHAVAAVRRNDTWLLLDSQHPSSAYRLDHHALACSFDADVVYLVDADGPSTVLPSAVASGLLQAAPARLARQRQETRPPQPPRPAGHGKAMLTSRECGWPTARWSADDAAAPVQLLVFASEHLVHSRPSFITACNISGLHVLSNAKFAVESDKAMRAHLRLTVFLPSHAHQVRTQMDGLRVYVRQNVGWHVVAVAAQLAAPSRTAYTDTLGFHLPSRQRGRPSPHTRPPHRGIRLADNPFESLATPSLDTPATEPSAPAPAAPAPTTRNTPTRARRARTQAVADDMIGCLNARDLGTSAALGRLTAVSHLMSVRRVGVLAVQESKMLDTRQLPAQVGLKYHGSGAGRSKHHRRVGGSGFFVTQQAASYFTYLGRRPVATHSSKTRAYAAEWGHLYGPSPDQDIHVASVYLPDASKYAARPAEYKAALADLAADFTHYRSKPGEVRALGDWNARIAHASHNAVPTEFFLFI